MELHVEYGPGEVRVNIHGPESSPELQRVLAILQFGSEKIWAQDGQGITAGISPDKIVWAETLEDKLFIYTDSAMYKADCSLASLELRWWQLGLFRCGKSTVVNLNAVKSLRSCPGGRIEAVIRTGEKIMISRRYVPALREKLQGGI